MPHYTISGPPYSLSADSAYNFVDVTGVSSAGGNLVAPPGARFIAALVRSITGGASPVLEIRDGPIDTLPLPTLVQSVAAVALNTIDRRGVGGDLCARGIGVRVTNNPTKYEIEILWK